MLAVEEEEQGAILKKRLVCSGREKGLALRWGGPFESQVTWPNMFYCEDFSSIMPVSEHNINRKVGVCSCDEFGLQF